MSKKIIANTLIYTITDGISKCLSFILLPIVSYYLVPEQLGIAANFDILQSIILLLAGQAVVNALPYFFYERTKEQINLLISNLILIIVVSNLILTIIIFLLNPVISKYLHIGIAFQLLTIVSVLTHLVCNINSTLYRLENKVYTFSLYKLLQSIIQILLTIGFVVFLKLEAAGKIYSIVITFVIMGTLHFYLLYKRGYIKLQYCKKDVKTLLRFGIPLLPHSLSFWIKSGFDKILLTTYCGLAMNGLYSMAISFGAVYTIFNNAFSNAFVPYIQKRLSNITLYNELEEKRNIVKLTYKIFGGFICLSLLAVIICWLALNYIIDQKYSQSFQFVPWILLSLTINSFYALVVEYIYKKKKTFGLGLITFFSSIIQLCFTYVFIQLFKENGIKYSIVLGSLITAISIWLYSNKVYPMPWFRFMKKQ